MSKPSQQELPLPKYGARILHMSEYATEVMPRVRAWAEGKGIVDKLDAALEYCRIFSRGPEAEWKSHLHTDICFKEDRPSFTCTVCKRVEKLPGSRDYDLREGLKLFMLIGMIWDEREQDWGFHS